MAGFNASNSISTQSCRIVVRNPANSGISANSLCNVILLADAHGDGIADLLELPTD